MDITANNGIILKPTSIEAVAPKKKLYAAYQQDGGVFFEQLDEFLANCGITVVETAEAPGAEPPKRRGRPKKNQS